LLDVTWDFGLLGKIGANALDLAAAREDGLEVEFFKEVGELLVEVLLCECGFGISQGFEERSEKGMMGSK
jgi:hypothetical protein